MEFFALYALSIVYFSFQGDLIVNKMDVGTGSDLNGDPSQNNSDGIRHEISSQCQAKDFQQDETDDNQIEVQKDSTRKNTVDKTWECTVCNKILSREDSLVRHIRSVHHKAKPFSCTLCDKSFALKQYLSIHIDAVHHKLKSFPCKLCDKSFRYSRSLDLHVRAYHKKLKPFRCTFCDKSFTQKIHMKIHVDVVHHKLKPFSCILCDRSFGRKGWMIKHMNIVHRKLYFKHFLCTLCKKSFSSKLYLRRHVDIVHKKLKLFTCKFCKTSFAKKGALSDHLDVVHHKRKPFCTLCGKSFSNKRILAAHIDGIHHKLKYFNCPLCSKSFGYKASLHDHMKRCAPQGNPFFCFLCDKKFSSEEDGRKHIDSVHKRINTESLSQHDATHQIEACQFKGKKYPKLTNHESVCQLIGQSEQRKLSKIGWYCQYCSSLFPESRPLEQIKKHEKNCQNNKRKGTCQFCKLTFAVANLRMHEDFCRIVHQSKDKTMQASNSFVLNKETKEIKIEPCGLGQVDGQTPEIKTVLEIAPNEGEKSALGAMHALSGDDYFPCCMCSKVFSEMKYLDKHKQIKHPGEQFSKQIHQSKIWKTLDMPSDSKTAYICESNMDGPTQEVKAESSELSMEWRGQGIKPDELLVDTLKQKIKTEVKVEPKENKQSDIFSLGSATSDSFAECDKCRKVFWSQIYLEKHVRLKHLDVHAKSSDKI